MNTEKAVINNEYDYSNILPAIDYVKYLIKYLDSIFNNLKRLVDEDELKNKQFKPEYKEYNYAKSYSMNFNIYIVEKGFNNVTCKDYETFVKAIEDGNVNDVQHMDIKLNLSFKRGKGDSLVEYENEFDIIFKPYDIKFARISNFNDSNMNDVEQQIKEILGKFPVANCIFCDKAQQ